jgi:hypothetical protein
MDKPNRVHCSEEAAVCNNKTRPQQAKNGGAIIGQFDIRGQDMTTQRPNKLAYYRILYILGEGTDTIN